MAKKAKRNADKAKRDAEKRLENQRKLEKWKEEQERQARLVAARNRDVPGTSAQTKLIDRCLRGPAYTVRGLNVVNERLFIQPMLWEIGCICYRQVHLPIGFAWLCERW